MIKAFDCMYVVLFQVLFCGDLNEFKKPSEAPVSPQKSAVKSAKAYKKAASKPDPKRSELNSDSESLKGPTERAPVKRKRATSSAKENATKRASGAAELGKRRSKRHQNPDTTAK